MRTLSATPTARRRSLRGAACDETPRPWGDEPPAAATIADEAAPAAAVRSPPARPTAPSLDAVVSGAWDGLIAGGGVACPLCAAPMTPRWSAGAGVVGGRCGGCGTTLE